jgi:hypothetical protein
MKSTTKPATHSICPRLAQSGEQSPCPRKKTMKEDKKISHQVPIYFISEALAGSKKYYFEMEKICYAVVMSD